MSDSTPAPLCDYCKVPMHLLASDPGDRNTPPQDACWYCQDCGVEKPESPQPTAASQQQQKATA